MLTYSYWDLAFYFILYSFVGWAAEMCYTSVRSRHIINIGFLNLPFTLPYGIASVLLLVILPTMPNNLLLQYIATVVVCGIVWILTEQFVKNIGHHNKFTHKHRIVFETNRAMVFTVLLAIFGLIGYLLLHPLIYTAVLLLPRLLIKITVIVWIVAIALDFATVLYTIKTNQQVQRSERAKTTTLRLVERMNNAIWRRLQKSYPGVEQIGDGVKRRCVFADGICFDKLVWVFLISSFLGALIELCFCYMKGAGWMSRSSLLYGQFSVVWGFGAVVLTVALQRLQNKRIWMLFLAGFVIGGTYEYTCSVLSELVFGTVFWDYSDMPLNIGGRTNVVYCVYWGILAVIWMKVLYPTMEHIIEKIPPLPGKIITWIVVLIMTCNCVLTAGAMVRYTERQTVPEPPHIIAEYLDTHYDDAWMEHRWPNMRLTDK